jgi:hypothetical protein
MLSKYLPPIFSSTIQTHHQNAPQIHHLPPMQPFLPDTYLPYLAWLQPQQTHPSVASYLPLLVSILLQKYSGIRALSSSVTPSFST